MYMVLKDHKCLKLLNKVVRFPNGREKCGIYQFLTYFTLKKCIIFAPITTFRCSFYHNMTRAHIPKQYHKNRNLGTVLIIRQTRKVERVLRLSWKCNEVLKCNGLQVSQLINTGATSRHATETRSETILNKFFV